MDLENSPEFQEYMLKFVARLEEYGERAATIPVGAPGSLEWLGRAGKFWWQLREEAGIDRFEVATRMGVSVDNVRFLEFGIGFEEVSDEFIKGYANALGNTATYERFVDQIGRLEDKSAS